MEGILSREQFAKARQDFESAKEEYRIRFTRLMDSLSTGITVGEAKDLILNFDNAAVALYRRRKTLETGDLNA